MSIHKLSPIPVELVCENGHRTRTTATPIIGLDPDPNVYTCIGGSDWDHCDQCPDGWRDQASRDKGHRFVQEEVNRLYPDGFG